MSTINSFNSLAEADLGWMIRRAIEERDELAEASEPESMVIAMGHALNEVLGTQLRRGDEPLLEGDETPPSLPELHRFQETLLEMRQVVLAAYEKTVIPSVLEEYGEEAITELQQTIQTLEPILMELESRGGWREFLDFYFEHDYFRSLNRLLLHHQELPSIEDIECAVVSLEEFTRQKEHFMKVFRDFVEDKKKLLQTITELQQKTESAV